MQDTLMTPTTPNPFEGLGDLSFLVTGAPIWKGLYTTQSSWNILGRC